MASDSCERSGISWCAGERRPRASRPPAARLGIMSSQADSAWSTPFVDLVRASERIAATSSRLEKKRICVELLTTIPEREIAAVVGWLVEQPLCGPLGVGPAALWELSRTPAPGEPVLTIADVEQALGQRRLRRREETLACVVALFGRLTETERTFVTAALTGTLRQGSLEGVMILAIADLSGQDDSAVRRAVMVTGSITNASTALLGPNGASVMPTTLELFRPIAPMLAASAQSVEDALVGIEGALVEWKVDGVRAQVHKRGDRITVYSRQGNDITAGCGGPLLSRLSLLNADAAILDGELFLASGDGTARPFQDSFSAVASARQSGLYEQDPLCLYLFDCMHRDGRDLLDEPLSVRVEAMRAIAPAEMWVPQLRFESVDEVSRFYAQALSKGHEGVMIKDPLAPYRFGGRGRAWQKVKESKTVDLVVLAAEWGGGRRTGFLSNLHLGALRDDGTFCMVGKTFKGLTDAMLRWQTTRLHELAADRTSRVVRVRPELVVEIRFNDVQRSPRYPGGIALRFARVVRHRPDKSPRDAEPLDALVAELSVPPGRVKRSDGWAGSQEGTETADGRQLTLFDD
jgi:DNA ligase-1